MKTTIDIADPILRRAKQLAARKHTTLKNVLEEALRRALQEESASRRRPARLQTHVFSGRGLQPGLSWDDWNALRSLAYEDHGG